MKYPVEPIAVEYDCRGKRTIKVFVDMYAARRFYVLKDKQGKHPKVVKSSSDLKQGVKISGEQ